MGNFIECPYCEHWLHIDCFPPGEFIWKRFRPSCYDCSEAYLRYLRIKANCQNVEKHRRWRKHNLNFRLAVNLRGRLHSALRGKVKTGSHIKDLGCTVAELKTHLESQFDPEMTWNNYGVGHGKWNIDHIMPMTAFNLQDRQHLVLACHYLNLQPMWHDQNSRKGGANRLVPQEF